MTQKIILAAATLATTFHLGCSSENAAAPSTVIDSGAVDTSVAAADTGVSEAAAPGPGEFKADYKTSTAFFTNMSAPVKGTSPHGTVKIWYSNNIKELLSKSAFSVPEGTTSIKEFDMTGDGTKTGIAVMVKKPKGYDSENGDWYYDMRDMSGKVMADPPAGKITMCIGCHGGYKATDFLAGTKVK